MRPRKYKKSEISIDISDNTRERLWRALSNSEKYVMATAFSRARRGEIYIIVKSGSDPVATEDSWYLGYQDALRDLFGRLTLIPCYFEEAEEADLDAKINAKINDILDLIKDLIKSKLEQK